MKDKSVKVCQNRLCNHAVPLPVKKVIIPEPRFPIAAGDTIRTSDCELLVYDMREDGTFDALVVRLDDASQEHGHYGSYVSQGRYYHFVLLSEEKDQMLWEVPSECTERFHREGHTGAQFLLYWFKDSGFSLDLDS